MTPIEPTGRLPEPASDTAPAPPQSMKLGKHRKRFPGETWPRGWPETSDAIRSNFKGAPPVERVERAAIGFAEAGLSSPLAAVDRMMDACGLPIDETANLAAWITSDKYLESAPNIETEFKGSFPPPERNDDPVPGVPV